MILSPGCVLGFDEPKTVGLQLAGEVDVERVTLTNNTISDASGDGVYFDGYAYNVTLTNNTITGAGGDGVYFSYNFFYGVGAYNVTLTDNTSGPTCTCSARPVLPC